MAEMHVTVRVDVATRRPPAEHDFICVSLSVPLPDHVQSIAGLNQAIDRACVEARETACRMASLHPFVVMPVRATVIDIDCI